MRSTTGSLAATLALLALGGCRCDVDPLAKPVPGMVVEPDEVHLQNVPVAQDTRIVIRVTNDRTVSLHDLDATLLQGSDPAFTLIEDWPTEVLPRQTAEITVVVRPRVVSLISAQLLVFAEEDAQPRSRVVVPITVDAVDAGLPDICEYPESIEFDRIGVNDVARSPVHFKNCGIRDLIMGVPSPPPLAVEFVPDVEGDDSIHVNAIPEGLGVGPDESFDADLVFAPQDLEEHCGVLVARSNDPDEPEVSIRACGQAAECPVACIELPDGADGVEPFDTVRIDGRCSSTPNPDTVVEGFQWTQTIRPVGSTAELTSFDADRVELPTDIAGQYCVQLHVTDSTGVRSCEPANVCFDVVPTEDLHIQLVWDHPDADLDLHLVRDNGAPFNHDTDCYFSNRQPDWFADQDQNPSLDHDDDEGYGPENINVVHPAPGQRFTALVHYWRAQTDGSPRTTATLRVFVYGQQVIEVNRTFEGDEQLWDALDITWPNTEGDPAAISQVGQVTPFPRPF